MKQSTTLDSAIELFHLDSQARRLTPKTQQTYKYLFSLFRTWCNEQDLVALSDIKSTHIRAYLASYAKHSSAYQYDQAKALRAFFNYCVRDELISATPFTKIKMPQLEKKIPKVFTPVDIKKVLKVCESTRNTAICLTLLDSGLRASELCSLNVRDINLQTGCITVHHGKQQKERITFIGAKARKVIYRYFLERNKPADNAPAFASERQDVRLTVNGLILLMRRLRIASGVEICSCHTFRRTFATNCLRNGMQVNVLAKLMGHADLGMLRQYVALVEDDLREAHERYGPMDNME